MRSKYCIAAGIVVIAAVCFGCGKKSAQAPSANPQAVQSAVTDAGVRKYGDILLPAWAPKDPSPAFLRAAKVLKPLPDELFALAGPNKQVMLRQYAMTAPAAFEFFGTLSDKQMQKFRASGKIRIPIKQLTASQRKALDTYFDRFNEAHKDDPKVGEFLVRLYKSGATQDLSNVDVGFYAAAHSVFINFWAKRTDGSVPEIGQTFAYM